MSHSSPFSFSLSTRQRAPEGGLKAMADIAFGRPTTIFATAYKRTIAIDGNLHLLQGTHLSSISKKSEFTDKENQLDFR